MSEPCFKPRGVRNAVIVWIIIASCPGESCAFGIDGVDHYADIAFAETKVSQPRKGQLEQFLNCENLGKEKGHRFWSLFRQSMAQNGIFGEDTVQLAVIKWTEWEIIVEKLLETGQLGGQIPMLMPAPIVTNKSALVETLVHDRRDLVVAFQRASFQMLYIDGDRKWPADYLAGFMSCPIGFVLVQYVVFMVHKTRSEIDDVERRRNWESMAQAFGLVLGLPPYALDFLESSRWGLTSFDMIVNLNHDNRRHWESYAGYCKANPVPPPVLNHWTEDAPELAKKVPEFAKKTLHAGTKSLCTPGADGSLRIALVGEHGGVNMDHLSTVVKAVRQVCLESDVRLATAPHAGPDGPKLDAAHFFTYLWHLAGTSEGNSLQASLRMSWEGFWGEPLTVSQGRQAKGSRPRWTVEEAVLALRAYASSETFLKKTQVIVCCEPLWLCILLHAAIGPRRLLVRASMCLLHAFTHVFGESGLDFFWPLVRQFAADMVPRGTINSYARITAEMLAFQTGMRTPYVPALSLHLLDSAPYSPKSRDVLMFRSQMPSAPSVKRVLALLAEDFPDAPKVIDMPKGLPYPDIASYRAVVIIPHVPFALRLSDVYAMAVPTLVPAEPLIHKFVWPYAGPFCGRSDPEVTRRVDPLAVNRSNPPYSPFQFQGSDFTPWAFHQDRRYWLQYSEWELRPYLLRFYSFTDLLRVASISKADAWEISSKMREKHQEYMDDALSYWRVAAQAAAAVPDTVGEGGM